MCGVTREVDDFPMLIILRCDDHNWDGFHRDSIHNLYWPMEETPVLADIPILPPKVLFAEMN